MRSITESVEVSCGPERLFKTLHTPSEIYMWWNARTAVVVPQLNGVWVAAWGKNEDEPDYVTMARLKVFDPPKLLVLGDFQYWAAGRPMAFANDISTSFHVEPSGENSRLTVTQVGFPDGPEGDEFYHGCCQGWNATLAAIRDYF